MALQSLWGISTSQGRYLHTEQHKDRINAHRHPCLRTHDPSVRASEDSSCLRTRGYCDRHFRHICNPQCTNTVSLYRYITSRNMLPWLNVTKNYISKYDDEYKTQGRWFKIACACLFLCSRVDIPCVRNRTDGRGRLTAFADCAELNISVTHK
jgi:hypothetical protein